MRGMRYWSAQIWLYCGQRMGASLLRTGQCASLYSKPTWCGLYSTSMSAWACWQQRRRELRWHGAWGKGLAGQLRGHQPGGRPEITNAQELGPSGGVLENAAAALRGPDSGCCAAHSWGAADIL